MKTYCGIRTFIQFITCNNIIPRKTLLSFFLNCFCVFSDGCALFRQFVAIEHSEENLDFWQHCEEFKRLKRSGDGEKAAGKARQIFDLHLSTSADKEVFFALIFFFLTHHFYFKGQFGQCNKRRYEGIAGSRGFVRR